MDTIVLGAGMVGVGTALALQQRGHAVILVDRTQPGRETSYGNAGIIQREAVQPYAFPRDIVTLARIASGISNDAHYHPGALWGVAPQLFRYGAASAPRQRGRGKTWTCAAMRQRRARANARRRTADRWRPRGKRSRGGSGAIPD